MWPSSDESSTSSSEEEGERGLSHYTAEYFLKKSVPVECVHIQLGEERGDVRVVTWT